MLFVGGCEVSFDDDDDKDVLSHDSSSLNDVEK